VRKMLSAAALLALAAAVAVPAAAQMRGMRGGMHGDGAFGCGMMCGGMMGGGMMGGMLCGMADGYDWSDIADKLKLNADQKEKIMEQNRETVRKMMEARNELQLNMFDLNTEMKMAKPDQKKIDSLIDEISMTRKRMLEQRVSSLSSMRQILTKEQWMMFKHMQMKGRGEEMPMGMQGSRRMMME
jgi:Spy/CpxP family protein refolding chaperone